MSYLPILRTLVDQQQFAVLQANAKAYLTETADVQALPLLALAHAHLGERQEALDVTGQAYACLTELDLDARVDLAGACCVLLRLGEAAVLLEAVLDVQPDHALSLARLAWCRMHMGKIDEARTLYQRSATLAPHRLPVWSALARLCLQAGDMSAAQQAMEAALVRFEALYADLPEETSQLFTAQLRGLQLEIWVAGNQIAEAEQWLEARRDTLDEEEWTGLVVGYATLLAGQNRHSDAEAALHDALKHFPKNIALLSQLAELAQIQGRTMQAVHLLRRAIHVAKTQDKPEIPLWVRLSGACLHQMNQQARKAAEKAVDLVEALVESEETPASMIRQLSLKAKNALAQVESQEQHFELAESLFRAILNENPWFLPALQGLGHQQMQRGMIDEAIALFERIKQIDPAKGYSSLINARQFPEDDATLAQMEKIARQPSLEGSTRSGILLQLAAAWEKRKDYDKAFLLAQTANEASKKLLHYNPKAHRQRCARIRHAFCRELYQYRRDCGVDSTLPVYVLGMPRSGTTLVEQILAGHSQICGAGELGVIPQLIAGLERWERHTGSGRHYPDCIDDLTPEATAGIASNVLKELQEYDPTACHVVDKLPHNFENIGLIKFFFPKAKIISVRRDPRDIAISNFFTDYQAKHGGMGFAYDLTWIGEQLADHNLMMHHWHQVFPGEILEIHYEEVVENIEAMARKMLDYIGVAWEPQVLAFHELERPVKTASVWQVRQPIYKTSKEKWRRYQNHLRPLIQGTNAKIQWDPIEMVTLPEPGLLTQGVELYKQNQLDAAEYCFKKLLHHLPEHAAANFMLGIIYAQKGYLQEAIPLMETAHTRCPWNPNWRRDLIQAYQMAGESDKAAALQQKRRPASVRADRTIEEESEWPQEAPEEWPHSDRTEA